MQIQIIVLSLVGTLGLGCAVDAIGSNDPDAAIGSIGPTRPTGSADTLSQVWKPSSVHIAIRSGGYWDGSSGYEIDRSAMSQAQIESLNGLALVPTVSQGNVEDVTTWTVAIRDSDGTQATYRAVSGNAGVTQSTSDPVLDVHTLEPFLATYDCLTSDETRIRGSSGPDVDATAPPDAAWASAPKLPTDPACTNGVFLPYECADVWLQFVVDRPTTYAIDVAHVFESVAINVLGLDGSLLASSGSVSSPNTPSIRYAFTAPGTYIVDVQKTNLAGCASQGVAGDVLVHVTRQ